MKAILVFTLNVLICYAAIAQNDQDPPFLVEVGAFAEPVGKAYFEKLQGVYETVDVNYIYRYYINAKSKEEAESIQQEAKEKGFLHARVIDVAAMQDQCDYFCEYEIPPTTKFIDWNSLSFDADVQVDVSRIQSIFFDYDRFLLRKKSKAELTKLGIVLYQNEAYTVELRAHTDDKGSSSYNKQLSYKRATTAMKFLVDRGISEKRILIKTYGEDAPIAKNQLAEGVDSEVGRQFNRRVEIVVKNKKGEILNIVDKIYVPEELRDN
jgi:outer membrane protein OmpA-like peptidoglycan-associated protein